MDTNYQAWQKLAPLGFGTIGLGVSLIGHATILKQQETHPLRWVALGTIGLCCLNAGVAMFGEAVKRRTIFELSRPPV